MKKTIMDYPPELRTNNHEIIFARGREKGQAKIKLLVQERINEVLRILQRFGCPCDVSRVASASGHTERTIRKYVGRLDGYVVKYGYVWEVEKLPHGGKEE